MNTARTLLCALIYLFLVGASAMAFDDWGTEVWPTPENTTSLLTPYYGGDFGNDNLWENYWSYHGHVWVSCSDSKYRENSPLITTTVADLDPTKIYNVYVYYFDRTLSDNLPGVLMAGMHGQSLVRCDRSNSEWEIVYLPENIERYRKRVGQAINITSFSVDIDDVMDGSGRAMYAGIEYKEAQPGTLSGNIVLQNFGGDISIAPVGVQFLQDGVVRYTRMVTLAANGGSYSINDIPEGDYVAKFKAASWLGKSYPVVITAGGSTTQDLQLTNGDIDGDNEITTSDLSISLMNIDVTGD